VAFLAFAVVTALVAAGSFDLIDRAVVELAQRAASPWIDLLASAVSLGGRADLIGAVTLWIALAWWRRSGLRGLSPLLLIVAVALEIALKYLVPQEPPPPELARSVELVPALGVETPFAFPSGHVLRATFIAALLWPVAGTWQVALALGVALMAVTRVYLAEHWPSDVVGGALLGLATAALALSMRPRGEGSRSARRDSR
jgi:membrane-associated phospholipid phosphatase